MMRVAAKYMRSRARREVARSAMSRQAKPAKSVLVTDS